MSANPTNQERVDVTPLMKFLRGEREPYVAPPPTLTDKAGAFVADRVWDLGRATGRFARFVKDNALGGFQDGYGG